MPAGRSRTHISGRERLESGQALVHFALMGAALMAMLALIIDVGLVAVQKRFDQNAADAGALGIARLLTGKISVGASGQVTFAADDATLQGTLTQLVGANAHTGLASRTTRLPVLEISADDGASWCAVQAGGCPTPPPAVASAPYLVRVTVASRTTGFFTSFVNPGPAAGCPAIGGSGVMTCARAVVSISGSTSLPPGMQVIPATLPSCSVLVSEEWQVHELWGSNSSPCHDTGGWKNLLDFTPYSDIAAERDAFHGDGYTPDSVYTGSGKRKDLTYWIAHGFGGTVTAGDVNASPPNRGTWLLTGKTGTAEGCISRGFYGGGGACEVNGRVDEGDEAYFFDNAKLGKTTPVPYGWFDCSQTFDPVITSPGMRVGCRDVAIAAWDSPEVSQGTSWVGISSGEPDRVHIAKYYVFRFYCGWSSDGSRCDQRPPSSTLPGCPSFGSGICGRLKSVEATANCPMCIAGPSVTVNAVRLRD